MKSDPLISLCAPQNSLKRFIGTTLFRQPKRDICSPTEVFGGTPGITNTLHIKDTKRVNCLFSSITLSQIGEWMHQIFIIAITLKLLHPAPVFLELDLQVRLLSLNMPLIRPYTLGRKLLCHLLKSPDQLQVIAFAQEIRSSNLLFASKVQHTGSLHTLCPSKVIDKNFFQELPTVKSVCSLAF